MAFKDKKDAAYLITAFNTCNMNSIGLQNQIENDMTQMATTILNEVKECEERNKVSMSKINSKLNYILNYISE